MNKVTERIRKCLTLANDPGAYEQEALAALTMARRLMAMHKLSEADLGDRVAEEVEEVDTGHSYHAQREPWLGNLAKVIAMNHCCRTYFSRAYRAKSRSIHLVGFGSDAETARQALNYAVDCIRSRLSDIRKEMRGVPGRFVARACNSYGLGFVDGLTEAYQRQDEEELGEDMTTAVVMQTPEDVNRYMLRFGSAPGVRIATGDEQLYAEGQRAGENHLNKQVGAGA